MVPVEKLPDDVQRELENVDTHIQVEMYPGHGIIVFRSRKRLSIRTDVLVVPFSFVDQVFLSRLQILVSANGGTVIPANGPTPALDSGTVHVQ